MREVKLYKEYLLLQDLPELAKGSHFYWSLWLEKYTDLKYIGSDRPTLVYSKSFVESKPDWFKPLGEAEDFYEKFPEDFAENHFCFGELRHNKMCRFCHDARDVLASAEFESGVTNIFRELYDKRIATLISKSNLTDK